MLIQLNGVWLTNDGTGTYSERQITSAQEIKLNGKQLVQIAQFLRGPTSIPYARLNPINELSFKVTRNFALINPSDPNPIASAESYMILDFWTKPLSGVLTFVCGQVLSPNQIYLQSQNAILNSSPSLDATGVKLIIEYTLQCSTPVVIPTPGSTLLSGTGGTLLSGSGGSLLGG